MKYSCTFFISNPGAQLEVSRKLANSIAQGIEANSRAANRQPDPWTLTHHIFRDVAPALQPASNDNAPTAHAHSYQHLLHLSYLSPDRTYTFVHPPEPNQAPLEMTQIPRQQTDSHYNMLLTWWAALWTPQRTLEVPHGVVYKVRDFALYIGELHSKRQGQQSANVLSPGVVVCITTTCGRADDDLPSAPSLAEPLAPEDFEGVQHDIRGLWAHLNNGVDFGKAETREFMQVAQDFDGKKDQEQEAVVRMWCEALRTRG
jgi:hypothetical protein